MDKTCTKCLTLKFVFDFHKSKQTKDGFTHWCKDCKSKSTKAYALANKKQVESKQKEWRNNNPRNVKSINLKRRYGITIDQYESMLEKQNSCCAICKSISPNRLDIDYFLVDHDHKTGKIRGLLCDPCNKGLANFKDSQINLTRAIEYICKNGDEHG